MSDRRNILALALTLGVVAPWPPAGAQSRPMNVDSLRVQARLLDSVAIERSRVVDSMRKAIVRSAPPVAIRRGALDVRTVPSLEARVAEAVDSVAALIGREGGPPLAARVSAHVPVIRPDSARAVFGMLRGVTLVPDTAPRSALRARRLIMTSASSRQLAEELSGIVEQFAAQGMDSSFAAWLMVGWIPLRPVSGEELEDVYTELATTPSAAIRRCRSGENAACFDVLGLDSLPGSRLSRWYSPEDYRGLLRTVAPPREDSAGVAAWVRCRERHDDGACITVATALPNDRIPLPLPATARAILVREALDAGGPGAYGRLVDASGSVRARLEHAAGQSADRIVARWRQRVENARPDRMSVRPGLIVASLGWTGALLGLTLLRRRP